MSNLSGFASGIEDVVSRFGRVEALQDEVRGHVSAITDLLSQIARTVATRSGRAGRKRRGRPRLARNAARGRPRSRRSGPRGQRAKRGELRAAIHKILSGGRAARPADIVSTLPKVGFKSGSTPKVLYTTVYLSLKKDPLIKKTSKGFTLRSGRGAKTKSA
jgi:hypothetical protein